MRGPKIADSLTCFLLIFLIFFVLVICGTTRAVQQAAPPDRAAGVQGQALHERTT